MISNNLKVGFATSTSATAPTFSFLTSGPVYVATDKGRYLYEEVGRGRSSYSGMFVEDVATVSVTIPAYLTPSLLYRILTEFTGLVAGRVQVGTDVNYSYSTGTSSITVPSYSAFREFALFHSDGTTNERANAVLTGATIVGEQNGMIMCELTVLAHSPTQSSITYPTAFNEASEADKFTTLGTTLSSSVTSLDPVNVNSFGIEFATGITDLTAKMNNVYRAEGGSASVMVTANSTIDADVKTAWEDSTPSRNNITFTIANENRTLTLTINNTLINERTVEASINEVVNESTTWTSAPFSVTGRLTVPNGNDIIIT